MIVSSLFFLTTFVRSFGQPSHLAKMLTVLINKTVISIYVIIFYTYHYIFLFFLRQAKIPLHMRRIRKNLGS